MYLTIMNYDTNLMKNKTRRALLPNEIAWCPPGGSRRPFSFTSAPSLMPSSKQIPEELTAIPLEIAAPISGAPVEGDGEVVKSEEDLPAEVPPAKKFKIDSDEGYDISDVDNCLDPALPKVPPLSDTLRESDDEEGVVLKEESPNYEPPSTQPKNGNHDTNLSNEVQALPEFQLVLDARIEAEEEGDEDSALKTAPNTSGNNADEGKGDDTNDQASLGPTTSIILPYEDFAADAEKKLNFANGRIFQRKRGVKDVHDGQLMVRLKKKRFVILDYVSSFSFENCGHSSFMIWAQNFREKGCGPSLLKYVLQFVFNCRVVNVQSSTFQSLNFVGLVMCSAHCVIFV